MRCRELIMGLVLALALGTAELAPSAPAVAAPDPSAPATPEDRAVRVTVFRGWAFDACVAPPVDTMRRWHARSSYRAVGVYFGGRGRACVRQPHLSRAWMRAVRRMGWRVLPVYVGSQAPCVLARNKKHVPIGRHPWPQGRREARDAVRRAHDLGMRRGSPLYLDIEAYPYRHRECARTTLSFVRAWNREVRAHGYVPGFYSSADSGVRHMELARRAGVADLPAVLWFARWQAEPHLYREPALARHAWRPARRIHQYAGNVRERHGGRTLVIDRNLVHAPVARVH